jgi:hypothetical protein
MLNLQSGLYCVTIYLDLIERPDKTVNYAQGAEPNSSMIEIDAFSDVRRRSVCRTLEELRYKVRKWFSVELDRTLFTRERSKVRSLVRPPETQ